METKDSVPEQCAEAITTVQPEQQEIVQELSPVAPYASPAQRFGAFLLDIILVWAIEYGLLMLCGGLFVQYGNTARLVGYLLGVACFAIPQSRIGKGQTFGQWLFRIRVVDRNGAGISPVYSLMRFTVLWSFFLIWELAFPIEVISSRLYWIVLGIAYAIPVGVPYFILFNRRTRQGLHDLAVGAFVVKAPWKGPLSPEPVSRIHAVIFPVLVILCGVSGLLVSRLLMPGILADPQALADPLKQIDGGIVTAIVRKNVQVDGGKKLHIYLAASVDGSETPGKVGYALKDIARAGTPGLDRSFMIFVTVREGAYLGPCGIWKLYSWSGTALKWPDDATASPRIRTKVDFF